MRADVLSKLTLILFTKEKDSLVKVFVTIFFNISNILMDKMKIYFWMLARFANLALNYQNTELSKVPFSVYPKFQNIWNIFS